jgi:exodeoxyribonuclease VII large subunit
MLPRCIGILTSPTGAAIQDILRILRRRHENVRILIYPRVQGQGAATDRC